MNANKYQPIIGLEVHAELKTKSKMFCSCSADYFGHDPNTHVCPVCLGLPGALPVPNRQAIEWCLMLGAALNCQIPSFSKFNRKNYFYPDLPKGYQISQYDSPFCVNGSVILSSAQDLKLRETKMPKPAGSEARLRRQVRHDTGRKIGIRRVHMEEDTGKLVHAEVDGERVTLIDFNRSGVPLVEVVTEPDIHSAQEAKLFLQKIQQLIRYLGISDGDMEKGSVRFEPNISLRSSKTANATNTTNKYQLPNYKVEVKNINSFRFVERAIEYEIERQREILEDGGRVTQETRGFDERKMATLPQRGKEEAQDYRYFPEPDIPPLNWEDNRLKEIKEKIPELPDAKLARFTDDYHLLESDAQILTASLSLANYFEEAVRVGRKYSLTSKQLANVVINRKIDTEKILPAKLIQIILEKQQTPVMSKEELVKIIDQVLLDNEKAINDYRKGKEQALMFLVGQVMRKTQGKAAAKIVERILERKLK